MGLDGISINQLRNFNEITPNTVVNTNQNNTRIVDGLSKGQKVDPDEEKNKENSNQEFFEENENDNDTAQSDEKENEKFNSYKIDLSQANKYELKVNENSNSIVIVEVATQKIVQVINADNLAVFVKNLVEAKGGIVNRTF